MFSWKHFLSIYDRLLIDVEMKNQLVFFFSGNHTKLMSFDEDNKFNQFV